MPGLLLPRMTRYKSSFQNNLLNNWHIRLAAEVVHDGGVIAYPTEAVYGMGCSPWNEQAVRRILKLKRRPLSKGLIIVAANIGQLHSLVDFRKIDSISAILKSWPGHVTWVLPAQKSTPGWLTGAHAGLAVRISAHPLLRQLCELCGPLVSTSANLSGTRSASSAAAVRNYFRDELDYILPGKLGDELVPSEIRHGASRQTLRDGKS